MLLSSGVLKIVFADSLSDHPNIDANSIEALITSKTKAIVVVHYAGVACDMDIIMKLENTISYVVEDAAQAIDSYYKKNHLEALATLLHFPFMKPRM